LYTVDVDIDAANFELFGPVEPAVAPVFEVSTVPVPW
jgi:hypothetical protein